LYQILTDPMCGDARGSVLSTVAALATNGTSTEANMVTFCVYLITLTINDIFNIRDIVVNEQNPAGKIDWTKVAFYFSDNTSWHLADFATGNPFTIQDSDFGGGNRGPNEFQVAVTDVYGSDAILYIRLTTNSSESDISAIYTNPNCGLLRGDFPINQIQLISPTILTVTFRYDGPLVTDFGNYVSDLMGLPSTWVKSCPEESPGFGCVQFFDIVLDSTSLDTTLWAGRMMQYINTPQPTDTNAAQWGNFSVAKN